MYTSRRGKKIVWKDEGNPVSYNKTPGGHVKEGLNLFSAFQEGNERIFFGRGSKENEKGTWIAESGRETK